MGDPERLAITVLLSPLRPLRSFESGICKREGLSLVLQDSDKS